MRALAWLFRNCWVETGMVLLVLLLVFLILPLSGCAKPETIRVPGPVEYRDRIVIQPIPAELLREHPISTGPLSECPRVASERRRELEQCNADKQALRKE